MAEESMVAKVVNILWSWWIILLTALDPNTASTPILSTITLLVFGVLIYLVIRFVVFEKLFEGLDENVVNWASFLITVGFSFLLVYSGMVYLAATMLSISAGVAVIGLGIVLIFAIYGTVKKGYVSAKKISKEAGAELKEMRRAAKEEKEILKEERIDKYILGETHNITKEIKQEGFEMSRTLGLIESLLDKIDEARVSGNIPQIYINKALANVSALAEKLIKQASKETHLVNTLDSLRKKLHNVNATILRMENAFDKAIDIDNKIADKMEKIGRRNIKKELKDNIAKLRRKIVSLKRSKDLEEKAWKNFKNEIKDIEKEINDFEKKYTNEISRGLKKLASILKSQKYIKNIPSVKSEIDNLRRKITGLENELTEIDGRIEDAINKLTNIQSEDYWVEKYLEKLERYDEQLEEMILKSQKQQRRRRTIPGVRGI